MGRMGWVRSLYINGDLNASGGEEWRGGEVVHLRAGDGVVVDRGDGRHHPLAVVALELRGVQARRHPDLAQQGGDVRSDSAQGW